MAQTRTPGWVVPAEKTQEVLPDRGLYEDLEVDALERSYLIPPPGEARRLLHPDEWGPIDCA